MAEGKLSLQAWMVAPETLKVMAALVDARFVGGCVRDALANRRVIDIDIATPLAPDEVIARLTAHEIGYAPTGIKHGTITAIVDGHPFEITTLRRDVTTDGRRAEVAFTDDWTEDAARRDFTMNAIFCDAEGNLFDPFGGIADLRLGRVRFVGDPAKRIEEDVLRILRFFRFTAHFGREEPDAEALKACAAAAQKIPNLSAERLRQETLKLLGSDRCAATWALMLAHGIAQTYLPEATNVTLLDSMVALENEFHTPPSVIRRLAALTHGAPPKDIARRLRLSNEQTARLSEMLEKSLPALVDDDSLRAAIYRLGNDAVRNLLLLAAARGEKHNLAHFYHVATSWRAPRFPLQGEDAMALGKQGPDVGALLRKTEDWWIGKNFAPTRAECLEELKKNA